MRTPLSDRPKNRYSTKPASGNKMSTVTHANDLTGLRFSLTITPMVTTMVMIYNTEKTLYSTWA